ncbi:hypothetical protein QJQ45_026891, partial [Haematococcus lacustris]
MSAPMDEDVEPQVLEDLQAELAAELADWGDAGSPTTSVLSPASQDGGTPASSTRVSSPQVNGPRGGDSPCSISTDDDVEELEAAANALFNDLEQHAYAAVLHAADPACAMPTLPSSTGPPAPARLNGCFHSEAGAAVLELPAAEASCSSKRSSAVLNPDNESEAANEQATATQHTGGLGSSAVQGQGAVKLQARRHLVAARHRPLAPRLPPSGLLGSLHPGHPGRPGAQQPSTAPPAGEATAMAAPQPAVTPAAGAGSGAGLGLDSAVPGTGGGPEGAHQQGPGAHWEADGGDQHTAAAEAAETTTTAAEAAVLLRIAAAAAPAAPAAAAAGANVCPTHASQQEPVTASCTRAGPSSPAAGGTSAGGAPPATRSAGVKGGGGQPAHGAAPRPRLVPRPSPPAAAAVSAPPCKHPVLWAGLCVVCGQEPTPEAAEEGQGAGRQPSSQHLGSQALGGASGQPGFPQQQQQEGGGARSTHIRHLHSRGHMQVAEEEARRLKQLEAERLRNACKLVLVLDLDHTLLNSVRLNDVSPEHAAQLESILQQEAGHTHRLLYCLRDKNLWTKLRPFVHQFLEACQPLFEMHIYTMGDRAYAAAVRALLDPQRRLFTSVISQNDSTSRSAKDLDVALADDSLVLIMDDTEQVWPRHRRNLIQVERYHFFPASCRQWGSDAASLLQAGRDESSSQGTLSTCLQVLRQVHRRFFNAPGAELPLHRRNVCFTLAQRRAEILEPPAQRDVCRCRLQGCHLVFSHCWPQGNTACSSHPLWLLAESLGAECHLDYSPDCTTHLV